MLVRLFRRRDREENECEHRKDKSLDEPHKYLEGKKRQRNKIRHKRAYNNKEDFTCKYVSEKTEGERNHLSKFWNKFKEPNKRINGIFKGKKLRSELPFGPFLITGTFIALLWGSQIVQWYLNYFQI